MFRLRHRKNIFTTRKTFLIDQKLISFQFILKMYKYFNFMKIENAFHFPPFSILHIHIWLVVLLYRVEMQKMANRCYFDDVVLFRFSIHSTHLCSRHFTYRHFIPIFHSTRWVCVSVLRHSRREMKYLHIEIMHNQHHYFLMHFKITYLLFTFDK